MGVILTRVRSQKKPTEASLLQVQAKPGRSKALNSQTQVQVQVPGRGLARIISLLSNSTIFELTPCAQERRAVAGKQGKAAFTIDQSPPSWPGRGTVYLMQLTHFSINFRRIPVRGAGVPRVSAVFAAQ